MGLGSAGPLLTSDFNKSNFSDSDERIRDYPARGTPWVPGGSPCKVPGSTSPCNRNRMRRIKTSLMKTRKSITTRKMLLYSLLIFAWSQQGLQLIAVPVARAGLAPVTTEVGSLDGLTRAPVLGADMAFAESPFPLIKAWQNKDAGRKMADSLRDAGVRSFRISFSGFYSPVSPDATARVKAENHLPNEYPWFPIDDVARYTSAYDFTVVIGINVEEGPDVAEKVMQSFINQKALDKILAVELSNEPWLNPRPWLPEEYAAKAADVIERLTPLGVHFALPLTVGKESKTPTRLSDDVWNERMLRALSSRIDLKNRTDIYGVLHLYSRGVSRNAVEYFNRVVKPFTSNMRYLVTEFNIKSSLEGNPHLTNEYAIEFARRVAELMASPEIEAIYTHEVPYHSIIYYANAKRRATVIGQRDPRLTGEALSEGWHLTPAGKVYQLYSTLAWNGSPVEFHGGSQSYWMVKAEDGRNVITLLNTGSRPLNKKVKLDGREFKLSAPGRSIVCFDEDAKQIEALTLPY